MGVRIGVKENGVDKITSMSKNIDGGLQGDMLGAFHKGTGREKSCDGK
jgi:hypothetical protein